jgi:hypothetical protein
MTWPGGQPARLTVSRIFVRPYPAPIIAWRKVSWT